MDMTLSELLENMHATPQPVHLAPPAGDTVWHELPGAARLMREGEEVLRAMPFPPPLPLSLWLRFCERGERSAFEDRYFARRKALCALAIAYCAGGDERFLRATADYAWAICEESAWQLPAHNSYVRDAPQLPLPDPERPVIDLFAAETAATLALLRSILGEALDGIAPGLSLRLEREVRRRVLSPYLDVHFWWMADTDDPKDTPTCNWTPWCTRNVLLAAAEILPEDELMPYIRKAVRGLDRFLDEYGEDGCCDEGAQYYSHAALALYTALELLCRMLPGTFEPIWSQPKLRNMAEYIVHMHVADDWYLNFEDCGPKAGRRGALEYHFARRVGSEALRSLAVVDFSAAFKSDCGEASVSNSDGISLYERIVSAFSEATMMEEAERIKHTVLPEVPDIWYPSVGVLVVRRDDYVLGAKAGNNADSHNHNDVGSVILYKRGQPLLIDVGVESYTRETFSNRRYEIWTMQSGYHNLPEFDPDGRRISQLPGAQARAVDVNVDADLMGIGMDIAPAYGEAGKRAGLNHYRRRIRLEVDGLALCDETDFPGTTVLNLMSCIQPVWNGDKLHFAGLAEAAIKGAQRVDTEAIPLTDPRLRAAWPETLWRTRIRFTGRICLRLG